MRGDREIRKAVLTELARLGIRAQIVNGGKHPMVVWEHNGMIRSQTLPGSPSDKRSKINNVCALRRMLRRDGVL